MNMMNKCAKSHKDSPSDKKVKFNLPSAIKLSVTAVFVYNFVKQPSAQGKADTETNFVVNKICPGVRFALRIIKALRLARIAHCSGTLSHPFFLL